MELMRIHESKYSIVNSTRHVKEKIGGKRGKLGGKLSRKSGDRPDGKSGGGKIF